MGISKLSLILTFDEKIAEIFKIKDSTETTKIYAIVSMKACDCKNPELDKHENSIRLRNWVQKKPWHWHWVKQHSTLSCHYYFFRFCFMQKTKTHNCYIGWWPGMEWSFLEQSSYENSPHGGKIDLIYLIVLSIISYYSKHFYHVLTEDIERWGIIDTILHHTQMFSK